MIKPSWKIDGSRGPRGEAGVTIIELLVSLVVFTIVVAAGLRVFSKQTHGFAEGAVRVELTQNLQYAATALTRDLRTTGTNVPAQQPFLVYAGPDVVAFHADYATNLPNDPFAVYYDPDAPAGAVSSITKAERFTLPGTSFTYPDTTYFVGPGLNSPAELLIFRFAPDSTTARADDFVLLRQVNTGTPEVVARNLVATPGRPFFQYLVITRDADGVAQVDSIPAADLPLRHSIPLHLSPADTGQVARIDAIRGVRINVTATNGLTGDLEERRAMTRLVWLRNAGLATLKVCGSTPIFGQILYAMPDTDEGEPVVTLSWAPAVDEAGGESDVIRYVLWRRASSDTDWGDPFLSIPAGSAAYSHVDRNVVSGESYRYAIAAQDCTPSLSPRAIVGPIAIP